MNSTVESSNRVIILGMKQVLGAAIATCFTQAGYLVDGEPLETDKPPQEHDMVYAVVLVPPVLAYDDGTSRFFRAPVDVFDGRDPRGRGRVLGSRAVLGDARLRKYIEVVAGPGTRLAVVSSSLCLEPFPTGPLEDAFDPGELPLLVHTQSAIVGQNLTETVSDFWSVSALPSGCCDASWGLGGTRVVGSLSNDQRRKFVPADAADTVAYVCSLRETPLGLVAGEADPPF